MADREMIPGSVQGFLKGKGRYPPHKARQTKEISEGPGPGCRQRAGIPRPAYLPVQSLRWNAERKKGKYSEWKTGYSGAGSDGVFTPAPAFGWSFRYQILCDACFNAFTCFTGDETTFGATAGVCTLVPAPDVGGAISCIFVSVIVVSCVVVSRPYRVSGSRNVPFGTIISNRAPFPGFPVS